MHKVPLVIIGAGPYGLSIAAHLNAAGMRFRIFGRPMHTWMTQMPKGMHLKSEGFASSLYAPDGSFTLEDYCHERNIPYASSGSPVHIQTFIDYGLAFQKRFVPQLEEKNVISIKRMNNHFHVRLDDEEEIESEKVIIAAGISHFQHVPPMLAALSSEFVTHSSQHSDVEGFKGRDVAIIGAGASALDLAALLHEAEAKVQLIARKPAIRFHDPPNTKRSLLECVKAPMTGIGAGWKLFFCANTPWAFRYLPEKFRLAAVKNILGPAPGWFIKDRVVGKIPFYLEASLASARIEDGKVHLDISSNGKHKTLIVDHVIAATGYKVNLCRLTFLASEIHEAIHSLEGAPILSSNFESSVRGLYFVGTSAANTFGPLMRFAFGAEFTAQRISAHLTKTISLKAGKRKLPMNVESIEKGKIPI